MAMIDLSYVHVRAMTTFLLHLNVDGYWTYERGMTMNGHPRISTEGTRGCTFQTLKGGQSPTTFLDQMVKSSSIVQLNHTDKRSTH